MSEIAPPPPPPPTPPPSSPVAQPTVVVSNPPRALANLAIGARLDAVIVTPETTGQTEIQTAFGRLAVQTGFPLPKEGPLQLQVFLKGPLLQLQIISIHGLPPQAALRVLGLIPGAAGAAPLPGGLPAAPAGVPQGSAAGTGGPAGPLPGAPAAAAGGALAGAVTEPVVVNLSVGATLTATLLKAGPATGTTSPATGQAGPTGTATGTGTGAAAPGSGQAPPPQGTTPAGTGAAAPGSPARPGAAGGGTVQGASGVPEAPASGQAPLPPTGPQVVPGTQFSLRITSFQPAGAGTGAGTLPQPESGGVLAPGSALNGIVTSRISPSGHPIVQTHGGALVIATRTPMPPGSTLNFEILSQAVPSSTAGAIDTPHAADPRQMLAGGWPSLEEAVLALQEVNPAAAQQLIHAVLPRPGGALAANMLFFLVALSGGSLRGWIGDGPARILQKLRPQLMARLREDFGQIGRIAEDSGSGEWRTLLIPLHNGAQIEQIRLFMRRVGDDQDEQDKARKGTRFIVDLDLSRLGRVQLDGFVYQKEKHMDLIVRTENRLPDKMHEDIRNIFQEAVDVTGIKGGVSFQAAPPNFIEVTPPAEPEEHLGLIV